MMIFFLLVAFVFLAYQRSHQQRIFVLHTFAATDPYTIGLNQGVTKALGDKHYLRVRHFYMDLRHYASRHYQHRVMKRALQAIEGFNPDLLLVFGHEAAQHIAKRFINKPAIKVVISGVDLGGANAKYKRASNVAGVIEYIPLRAVRELLHLMFHRSKKIYFLSGASIGDKRLATSVAHSRWPGFVLVKTRQVNSFDDWKKAVAEANQQADILLLGSYFGVKPVSLNDKTLVAWTIKHSLKPVIGLSDIFFEDGGLISLIVSPKEQGKIAAQLGLALLDKIGTLKNQPFIKSKQVILRLDKQQIKQRYPFAYIPTIIPS